MTKAVPADKSLTWIDVCGVKDLRPNSGVCALAADQQVAIFYLPEEKSVYAIGNYDPIGKANVLSRGIVGDVQGELVVASPLYKQHFSLKTGCCLENEAASVASFPARISGHWVQIAIDR